MWFYPDCVGLAWWSGWHEAHFKGCRRTARIRTLVGVRELTVVSECLPNLGPWTVRTPGKHHERAGSNRGARVRIVGVTQFHVKHRRTAPGAMSSMQFTVVLTLDDMDSASRCAGLRLFESTSVVTSLALQEHGSPLHVSRGTSRTPEPNVERQATSRISRGTTSPPTREIGTLN